MQTHCGTIEDSHLRQLEFDLSLHSSYTNFYYYALTVNVQSGNAYVTFSVANEGPMDGDEVRTNVHK